MKTTISPPCPIDSLRRPSALDPSNSSRMRFRGLRTPRRTPPSHMWSGSNLNPIIGQGRAIEAVSLVGRTGKATAFRTGRRVRTASSASVTTGIATIGQIVPREFRPYRDTQPPREMGGENMPATALPSFITGEPKSSGSESNSPPVPEQGSAPTTSAAPETGAAFGETAPNDPLFQGRGRRRRLRSPYGYSARQAAEEDPETPNADTIGDETPATE